MARDLDLEDINSILQSSGLSAFKVVRQEDVALTSTELTAISNGLTGVENSFNRILAYSNNVKKLHEAENRRLEMISRENDLERGLRNTGTKEACIAGPIKIVGIVAGLDEELKRLEQSLKQLGPGGAGGGMDGSSLALLAGGIMELFPKLFKAGKALTIGGMVGLGLDFAGDFLSGRTAAVAKIGASTATGAGVGGAAGAVVGAPVLDLGGLTIGAGALVGGIGGFGYGLYEHGGELISGEEQPVDGARAGGGPVSAGRSYLVGEKGPEVFTPNESGNISPNRRVGAPTVLKIVVVDQHPSSSQIQAAQKEFADGITKSIQRTVAEQRAAQAREESAAFGRNAAQTNSFMSFISSLFDKFKGFLGLDNKDGNDNGGGGSNLPPAGSTANAMIAFNFFKSKGWSDVQAAAMVGVMQRESGANLDPNIHNTAGGNLGAWGIAQWRGPRQAGRNVERALGTSSLRGTTFEQQLQYVQWELENTHTRARESLQRAQTIEQAVNAFVSDYEGVPGDNVAQRISNAWAILNGTGDVDMATGSTNMTGGVGRVTSGTGSRINPVTGARENHAGTDISAPAGTRVYSAADGVVEYSARDVQPFRGYGNAVVVRSNRDPNLHFLYGHFSRRAVTVGARVSAGQLIGFVGSTGLSSGNHLHFEIRHGENMGSAQPISSRRTYESNKWIVGGTEDSTAPRPAPSTIGVNDMTPNELASLRRNGYFMRGNQRFNRVPPRPAPRQPRQDTSILGRAREVLQALVPQL